MSNVPFNTITSILGTSQLQRQAAQAIDRNNQIAARSRAIQFKKALQHVEEIEDSTDNGPDAIHDHPDHHADQEKKKNDSPQQDEADQVDIASLSPEPAPPVPAKTSLSSEALPRLDISA